MSTPVTRRQFLGTSGKTAAGVAAGLAVGPMIRDAQAQNANDRLTIALIGCGGMGRYKLMNFRKNKSVDVAAVCDVDPSQMEEAAKDVQKDKDYKGPTPRKVKNYKEVIDMQDVDAVIIATPDHWHAIPMMLAVQAKKDVYCEKPCCHNIREGRAMVNAAIKHKRVVQVGTHQRSIKHIQQARKFVQNDELGVISQTNTFNYGNEAPDGLGNQPDQPVPQGVDYDTWLGPASVRPFNIRRFHNKWRWYFDYGAGMVGDWNVHLQDIIMWTMGVTAPVSVCTMGGKWVLEDDRDTPDTMQTIYEFAAADQAPQGFVQTYTMRKAGGRPWDAGGYGMVLHGTEGKLQMDRKSWKVEADAVDWKKPQLGKRIDDVDKKAPGGDANAHLAHVNNFIECVKTREKPIATIESHYSSVVACHLANVSLRAGGVDRDGDFYNYRGQQIFWDPKKELCFKDRALTIPDNQANQYLAREYRKGFELPEV